MKKLSIKGNEVFFDQRVSCQNILLDGNPKESADLIMTINYYGFQIGTFYQSLSIQHIPRYLQGGKAWQEPILLTMPQRRRTTLSLSQCWWANNDENDPAHSVREGRGVPWLG